MADPAEPVSAGPKDWDAARRAGQSPRDAADGEWAKPNGHDATAVPLGLYGFPQAFEDRFASIEKVLDRATPENWALLLRRQIPSALALARDDDERDYIAERLVEICRKHGIDKRPVEDARAAAVAQVDRCEMGLPNGDNAGVIDGDLVADTTPPPVFPELDDQKETPGGKSKFRLIPFGELTAGTKSRYLIKGLLPSTGLALIYGPPKSGKSFVAFDMLMAIARGCAYRSRRVRQGTGVYLALEGAEGWGGRCDACRTTLPPDAPPIPFYVVATPVNLVTDHSALIDSIRARLGGDAPAVVAIDTLNRSMPGSESHDDDMAAYIRAADTIRDAFGCLVIIVHHSGVDPKRPRGHTSLTGAVDVQIKVERDAAGNIIATVEFMKDGPEGAVIVSRLQPVQLGLDNDGDPITSCIVVPGDEAAQTSAKPHRKLPDKPKSALDVLVDLCVDGKPLPNGSGLPTTIRAVAVDNWRQQLYRRGVLDVDHTNPREDFRRVKSALLARQLVAERDGQIWDV